MKRNLRRMLILGALTVLLMLALAVPAMAYTVNRTDDGYNATASFPSGYVNMDVMDSNWAADEAYTWGQVDLTTYGLAATASWGMTAMNYLTSTQYSVDGQLVSNASLTFGTTLIRNDGTGTIPATVTVTWAGFGDKIVYTAPANIFTRIITKLIDGEYAVVDSQWTVNWSEAYKPANVTMTVVPEGCDTIQLDGTGRLFRALCEKTIVYDAPASVVKGISASAVKAMKIK